MENLIKGYLTSFMGLICSIAIILHWSGLYEFPNPDFLDKPYEIVIALIVNGGLFMLPYSKIESMVESIWNILLGVFKKKVE